MPEFDPYLKWLGIREKKRPINHYRLLGLDLFEDDPDVISVAADRQMTHIRTFQNGPNGDLSQKILNELARARRCLLTPEKKVEYDRDLRATLRQPVPPAMPVRPVELTPPAPQIVPATVVGQQLPPEAASVLPTVVPSSRPDLGSGQPAIGVKVDGNARSKSQKRERKQLVWSLLGWISGALAAVGVSAALLSSGILGNLKPDEPRGEGDFEATGVVDTNPGDELPAIVADSNPVQPNSSSLIPRNKPESKTGTTQNSNTSTARTESASPGNPRRPANGGDPGLFNPALTNLGAYPKASPANFGLFGEVKRGLREKKIVDLEASARQTDSRFRLTAENGILIGISFGLDEEECILQVQAIFHDGFQATTSEPVGTSNRSNAAETDLVAAIAKPGYAVADIQFSVFNPPQRARVRFMRIAGTRLDPRDNYYSGWIGRDTGPVRSIRNAKLLPIVGLHGSLSDEGSLATLSLVAMDPNATVENRMADLPRIRTPGTSAVNDDDDPFEADSRPQGDADPAKKLAEPSAREKSAAQKRFSSRVKTLIAEAVDLRTTMLAAEGLVDEAETESDPAVKFAMLEEALRLAVLAANTEVAVRVLRVMDGSFDIDFWKEVHKTIEKTAAKTTIFNANDFKVALDNLIDDARDQRRYDQADKLISLAIRLGKRAKNAEVVEEYERMEREVKMLNSLVKDSEEVQATLAANPNDPEANLIQGNYLWLLNDDFDGAIEHWARSSDATLARISNLEMDVDDLQETDLVVLADLWRNRVKTNRTQIDQRCLDRAYQLYKQAARSLTGQDRNDVDAKLDEVMQMLQD